MIANRIPTRGRTRGYLFSKVSSLLKHQKIDLLLTQINLSLAKNQNRDVGIFFYICFVQQLWASLHTLFYFFETREAGKLYVLPAPGTKNPTKIDLDWLTSVFQFPTKPKKPRKACDKHPTTPPNHRQFPRNLQENQLEPTPIFVQKRCGVGQKSI